MTQLVYITAVIIEKEEDVLLAHFSFPTINRIPEAFLWENGGAAPAGAGFIGNR